MKSLIVAVDKKLGIGADNDLLWKRDLPADLARFRQLTLGTSVIMGRKTYESIGRPLPERENIVISSKPIGAKGVLTAQNLSSAYALARKDIFICGGQSIYEASMNDVDRLYVTEVDAEFPKATVFFPNIDSSVWHEISREHHEADERNKYDYDYVIYERI